MRLSGVRERKEGTLVGVKGREPIPGEALARVGVRWGAYGRPSMSSENVIRA